MPNERKAAGGGPRYLVAVSARNLGVDAFRDGGWHVVGSFGEDDGGRARSEAMRLIPRVVGSGGDLAMYRLGDEPAVLMRRGGSVNRPPPYEDLHVCDPETVKQFEAAVARGPLAPAPKRRGGLSPYWSAGIAAALVAAVATGGAAWSMRAPAPGVARIPEDPDKVNALLKGAIQVTQVDPNDPDYMITVRYYPDAKGEAKPMVVDRFQTEHYHRGGGYVPTPAVKWLKDW